METKEPNERDGYEALRFSFPTKRYYQTLDLRDDPELIAEYKRRHSAGCYWKEIGEGIRSVGILDMEIFLYGTRLTMVVETAPDFEWDAAFARLATLPRQAEWEAYMADFQLADPKASSAEKWHLMERIFKLPE
jgi:L-rhamnose mutarotase